MLEGFKYNMARWLPFQDQAACEKARAVTKEQLAAPTNPNLKVEIIPDDQFPFRLVTELFATIKGASDEGRRLVLILPQPEPLYAWVAHLINQFQVDCRNLYTFDMDEYADQDGRIAPASWRNSFLYAMKHNFYGRLNRKLRPPEEHIQGPTDANFQDYGKMIADLGGAEVCFGGIGWSGHLAFIEPGSEAYAPRPWEQWKQLGPRIVELTPITVLQGVLGPEWGQSGDWSWYPPKAASIGPAEILGAKLRSSWCGFAVGASQVSWQRFIVRLAARGPVTPLIPASMLQTAPSELHLTETVAEDVVPAAEFSWYG